MKIRLCALVVLWAFAFPLPGQDDKKPEIISLLGRPLFAQEDEKSTLPPIKEELEKDPSNPAAMHKYGKQLTRLWRFNEGIEWMSRALQKKPDDPLVLLDRGHAYVNIRKFKEAEHDLKKAAGLDSKNFEIHYHLGLAYYFQGEFDQAAEHFRHALDVSQKDESVVSSSDWLYMSLRRGRKTAEAEKVLERISPEMPIKENTSYFFRLLFYKGLRSEGSILPADADALQVATIGYGIANWHFYNSRSEKAREYFEKIVAGRHWPAFGFIGAEVDLKRMNTDKGAKGGGRKGG